MINVSQGEKFSVFDLVVKLPNKKILKNISIPLIGIHNLLNATAAIAVSYYIGIPFLKIHDGLKNYKGVERRFNKILKFRNSQIFDDAHHQQKLKRF